MHKSRTYEINSLDFKGKFLALKLQTFTPMLEMINSKRIIIIPITAALSAVTTSCGGSTQAIPIPDVLQGNWSIVGATCNGVNLLSTQTSLVFSFSGGVGSQNRFVTVNGVLSTEGVASQFNYTYLNTNEVEMQFATTDATYIVSTDSNKTILTGSDDPSCLAGEVVYTLNKNSTLP